MTIKEKLFLAMDGNRLLNKKFKVSCEYLKSMLDYFFFFAPIFFKFIIKRIVK